MLKKTILISAVVALVTVGSSARGMNSDRQDNEQSVKSHQNDSHTKHEKNRGHKKDKAQKHKDNMDKEQSDKDSLNSDIPLIELSQTEKDSLIFMLEEEKLAKDVYTHLYDTWGTKVFKNIAKAEQKHMDSIETLVDKHEVDTPKELEETGTFKNEELQSHYDNLIAQGDNSLVDALEVGIKIEELDIADLEESMTDAPEDVKATYEKLIEASQNHLDAFNRQLARQ